MLEGQLIDIAANIGIVLFPAGATDCEQLLKNADLALHRAKSDGRGTYRFFEQAMDEKMQYRRDPRNRPPPRTRARRIRAGLISRNSIFRLNKVTGFEALLRWQSPTRGAVSPLEFIPVAEDTGIITSIGEWVLRTACREATTWPGDAHGLGQRVGDAVQSPNLVATMVSALGESGLDPRRLELEITESVMLDAGRDRDCRCCSAFAKSASASRSMTSEPDIRRSAICAAFRSTGSRSISPSSAARPSDAVGRAIVRAVASLGQSLGMATVAEGVETDGADGPRRFAMAAPMCRDF